MTTPTVPAAYDFGDTVTLDASAHADHLDRATQYAKDCEGCVSRALGYIRQGHIALAEDELQDAVEAVSGVRYRLAELARMGGKEAGE